MRLDMGRDVDTLLVQKGEVKFNSRIENHGYKTRARTGPNLPWLR